MSSSSTNANNFMPSAVRSVRWRPPEWTEMFASRTSHYTTDLRCTSKKRAPLELLPKFHTHAILLLGIHCITHTCMYINIILTDALQRIHTHTHTQTIMYNAAATIFKNAQTPLCDGGQYPTWSRDVCTMLWRSCVNMRICLYGNVHDTGKSSAWLFRRNISTIRQHECEMF